MASNSVVEDDDEELGALIYRSSLTAKRRKANEDAILTASKAKPQNPPLLVMKVPSYSFEATCVSPVGKTPCKTLCGTTTEVSAVEGPNVKGASQNKPQLDAHSSSRCTIYESEIGQGGICCSIHGCVTPSDDKIMICSESRLVEEITARYLKARQTTDRVSYGAFERMIEKTKDDMKMEDSELSVLQIRVMVRQICEARPNAATTYNSSDIQRKKDTIEEIYRRYAKIRKAQAGTFAHGALKAIFAGVELKPGMADINIQSLKNSMLIRFKGEYPELVSSKERRRRLMNEVTARYTEAMEAYRPGNLPKGELGCIVERAKNVLNIHEFDESLSVIRIRAIRLIKKSEKKNTEAKQNSPT